MKPKLRNSIRAVAFSVTVPTLGFLLVMLLEMFLDLEIPKLHSALINMIVVLPFAFILFPRTLGIPYRKESIRAYLRGIGFYWPRAGWKHVILGLALAGCTLSGMLAASLLSGSYVLDWGKVNLPQIVFSLNPGIWEEFFFRGVLMIFLLGITRDLKRAFLIQAALFGAMHIKGFGFWDFADVLSVSVIGLAFTYTTMKTRALVAGMVFHFVHDALLFFVQVPSSVALTIPQEVSFYGLLMLMTAVACLAGVE